MTAPAAYSTLVCYHADDHGSRGIAEEYKSTRGRRAKLLALPLTTDPGKAPIKLSQFRTQIQGPIFAQPRTRFIVLCRGVPWKLWSDDWKTQQCVDSNLTLPPEDGGGDLRPKGSPFLLDPLKVRSHPSFRFVSRIDGATAASAGSMIFRAIDAERKGWDNKNAMLTSTFGPAEAIITERGWTVRHGAITGWPEPNVKLWLGYTQSPAGAHFEDCALDGEWFGWATQSTGMSDMRSTAFWCPYCVEHGAIATLGATAEPSLAGFPMPQNILLPFLQWGWTWAEAVWFATPLINHRVAPIGDPTWRMPRSTRSES